jgi:SAM-dependent methyltransferase
MSTDQITDLVKSKFSRIRTGLVVGTGGDEVLSRLKDLRGGQWRRVAASDELPFEDGQFEVVVMDGAAVSNVSVKEAHRVMRPDGCLFFTVDERTGKQDGYELSDIYRIVRDGFGILDVKRPAWWYFGRRGRTLTVCARKKNWREYKGLVPHEKVFGGGACGIFCRDHRRG